MTRVVLPLAVLLTIPIGAQPRDPLVREGTTIKVSPHVYVIPDDDVCQPIAGARAAAGLDCAALLTRLMRAVLFAVTPTDAVTYATVSLLLIAIALTACYVPARRATKQDPLAALRFE